MHLTFEEAEFLGGILDRSIESFEKMPVNDLVAVAAFCGNDMPDDKDEIIQEVLDGYVIDLKRIREKIKNCYGI